MEYWLPERQMRIGSTQLEETLVNELLPLVAAYPDQFVLVVAFLAPVGGARADQVTDPAGLNAKAPFAESGPPQRRWRQEAEWPAGGEGGGNSEAQHRDGEQRGDAGSPEGD